MNKKFIYLGLFFAIVIYLVFPQTWKGYVYPDKSNLSKFIELGEFRSEEECSAAAVNTLRRVSSISAGDYECHRH
jgi:hypothetical protein